MEDTSIKLKRKVQLRKKVEEPEQTNSALSQTGQENNKRRSKIWLWILLTLIVLGTIGFIFFSKPDKNTNETIAIAEEKTMKVEEAPAVIEKESTTPENTEVISKAIAEENDTEETRTSTKEKQIAVEEQTTKPTTISTNVSINISDDIQVEAMKVIHGDYGVGKTRRNKLGDRYQVIQNRVNELKREGVF